MVIEIINRLLKSDPIKIQDKAKIISLLHNKDLWPCVAEILSDINSSK